MLRKQLPRASRLFILNDFLTVSDPISNSKLSEAIEAYMGLDEKGEYKAGSYILQMDSIHKGLLDKIDQLNIDITYLQRLLLQVNLIKANRDFFAIFLNITPEQVGKLSPQLRHWIARNALHKLAAEIQNQKESIELLLRAKNASVKDYNEEEGGAEKYKADIERLQAEMRTLQKDAEYVEKASNAVNRIISRLAEYEDKANVLAIQAVPKSRLFLGLEAGPADMKLDEDEKEHEAERIDPVTQLLKEKNLDQVLPHPPAFLNAKGWLWQNPVLQPNGTTIEADEVSKKKKTSALKQPILKRAMQQYKRYRDVLRQLQQTLLQKNKIRVTLQAQLADVDTDIIDTINFDFLEHTKDLAQITECIKAHDFLLFSSIEPEKHQKLASLIELEDKIAKILTQKTDIEAKYKKKIKQKNAVSEKISSLRDNMEQMLETLESTWSKSDDESKEQPREASSNPGKNEEKNRRLLRKQHKEQVKAYEQSVVGDLAELKVQEEAEKACIQEITKLEKAMAALKQEERQLTDAIQAIYANLNASEQAIVPLASMTSLPRDESDITTAIAVIREVEMEERSQIQASLKKVNNYSLFASRQEDDIEERPKKRLRAAPQQERKLERMDMSGDHSYHPLAQAVMKTKEDSKGISFVSSNAGLFSPLSQSHDANRELHSRESRIVHKKQVVRYSGLHDGDLRIDDDGDDFEAIFKGYGNSLP